MAATPGSHYMGNTGNNDFKADFEVDYMFAMNPASGTSSVFLDAVGLVGGRTAQNLGNCDQTGVAFTGPSTGGLYSQNKISFAFDNSGTANRGFEIGIPFSELGVTETGTMQSFAFLVREDAFFSDVTIPGNVTSGNLGYNTDFGLLSGGPYHTGAAPLPVELSSFTAKLQGKSVLLKWITETEVDNYGFEIERTSAENWEKIGFVEGHGNSNSPKSYSFIDENPIGGNNSVTD